MKKMPLLHVFMVGLLMTGVSGFLPFALAERSAIQRLNAQRAKRPHLMFLPTAFYRDKVNTVTVKSNPGDTLVVYYRFLPVKETNETPLQLKVQFSPEETVRQVQIPLPETEQYKAPASTSLVKKVKSNEEPTPAYQYSGIQIQAVRLAEDGEVVEPLELYDALGQITVKDALPLLDPYSGSAGAVLPSVQGLDATTMRSIQSLTELSTNEEKRKRLLYDGSLNRERSLDRNVFIDGGARPTLPGFPGN